MNTKRRARAARFVATSLLALWWFSFPAAARAHASPDHADPKVGSTVSAPKQVGIWFDSDLEPGFSSIAVHRPDGASVDDGHGGVDASDPKLLKTDVPHVGPGTYQVVWSVVSRDGHRTSGGYEFTVK